MKTRNLLLFLAIAFVLPLNAQPYDFSVTTGTYADLSGSTSLNNGYTWDDSYFEVPIGFDFKYFNQTCDTIKFLEDGLGATLLMNDNLYPVFSIFVPYGADIIDRGYDMVFDSITTGSLSNISYLLEGSVVGSRILKIEWQNVGFYSEFADDNISSDYTNFQLWLYEGSNDMEIHFGPNSISQPDLCFDDETGSFVALIPEYYIESDTTFSTAYLLEGNASSPTLEETTNLEDPIFLNGVIPNGTIYRFSKNPSSVSTIEQYKNDVVVYPNPVNTVFTIINHASEVSIESAAILDNCGRVIKEVKNVNQEISTTDLENGLYILEIRTDKGSIAKKLVVSQ